MDDEYENSGKSGQAKYGNKEFSITRKDRSELETDNPQKFLETDFGNDVDEIRLSIRTENKDTDVKINTSSWNVDSSSSATSRDLDDMWVNGMMAKLNEVFHFNKTMNDFWHYKKAYIIYGPVGIVLASFIAYISLLSPKTDYQTTMIFWLISLVTFPVSLAGLFKWMFPKIETKKQQKTRKIIAGIVGAIILSIIGSYIYDFIK